MDILYHTLVVIYFRSAGLFTMDVITSTAFGLKIDSQKDKNNQFVTMAKKLFDFSFFSPLVIIACKCTAPLTPKYHHFDNKLSSLHFSINF